MNEISVVVDGQRSTGKQQRSNQQGTKPNISTAAPKSRIVTVPASTVVRRSSDSVRSENAFAPCILTTGRA
jgi:hypothetical protein